MLYIAAAIVLLALSYSVIPTYYFKLFRKKPQPSGEIFLSFDDGPGECTPKILDLLSEEGVKATFFMVASFADKHPETVDRMIREGHQIGMHSLEHANAFFTGPAYVRRDFEQSMEIMARHGWNTNLYRAPWGRVNIFSLYYINKYKLRYFLWDTLVQDWDKKATPEMIYTKILERVKPGFLLCVHDGRGSEGAPARTYLALKQAIPALKSAGYSFAPKIIRAIGE